MQVKGLPVFVKTGGPERRCYLLMRSVVAGFQKKTQENSRSEVPKTGAGYRRCLPSDVMIGPE